MTSKISSVTLNFTKINEYIEPAALFELLKELTRKYPEWIITVVDGEVEAQ